MSRLLLLILSLIAVSQTVLCQAASSSTPSLPSPSSDTCVDPDGYSACYYQASDVAFQCMNGTDSNLQVEACGCVEYVSVMNCIATHCWNQVYSCEYQELAIDYLRLCPNYGYIPFFPPPDNAPAACSCNIGKVFLAVNETIGEVTNCDNAASASSDPEQSLQLMAACVCCGESASLSSLYSICPDTDPSQAGLDVIDNYFSGYNQPFSSCDQYLSSLNCVSDLGFAQIDGDQYYGPGNLSLTGTQSLSDGPGSITSPISGATFTWVPITTPVTIVAVSYTPGASPTGSGSSGSGSSGSGSSGSGSSGSGSSGSGSSQSGSSDSGSGSAGLASASADTLASSASATGSTVAGTTTTFGTSPSPTAAPSGASAAVSSDSTTTVTTSASTVRPTSKGHTVRASLATLACVIVFLGAMFI
ncbi:hypothetical protein V1509DRAFT_630333 [Lipomyces kononenkoae]